MARKAGLRQKGAFAALAALLAGTPTASSAADVKPLCTETTRACYLRMAKTYFEAVLKGDGEDAPFASDIRVTEQGQVLATSRAAFLPQFRSTSAGRPLRNLRFLVDTAKGEVVALALSDVNAPGQAPFTVRRIQRLKIAKGLIEEVELVIYVDQNAAALWPDIPQ